MAGPPASNKLRYSFCDGADALAVLKHHDCRRFFVNLHQQAIADCDRSYDLRIRASESRREPEVAVVGTSATTPARRRFPSATAHGRQSTAPEPAALLLARQQAGRYRSRSRCQNRFCLVGQIGLGDEFLEFAFVLTGLLEKFWPVC